MKQKSASGFTLIELVITMSIAAVLLGIGVPSFLNAVKNSRMNNFYSALVSTLYLARSEAVKQSNSISVCARANDTTCGSDWNNGWIAFVENPGAGTAIGTIDATDIVLKIHQASTGGKVIISNNALSQGAASTSSQNFIRYFSDGSSNWTGGTFQLCDDRGTDYTQALNIAFTGDIRRSRNSKDFQSNDLSC